MILFTATWCNPCKDLKKWLGEKGIEEPTIDFVDIDEEPEVAAKLGIRGVPCLVKDGEIFFGNEKIRPVLEKL